MKTEPGGSAPEEIPLFPLRTVLFPGGPLRLRIFEPRYLDMIRVALKTETEFGVLLIRSGGEVGPAETVEIGTTARVVDFQQLRGGLLGITCRGARRFRLTSRRQQRDGLNLGNVEWLSEPMAIVVPMRFEPLVRILDALLAELRDLYDISERRLADAAWVGYRLSEILPLPPPHRQRLLELDDPLERLAMLEEIRSTAQAQMPARDA